VPGVGLLVTDYFYRDFDFVPDGVGWPFDFDENAVVLTYDFELYIFPVDVDCVCWVRNVAVAVLDTGYNGFMVYGYCVYCGEV
jgi:hypothetical protein